eukprot:TRINITY_DN32769_c0_g1_i1.p1 TRINITY_DN32769_c0_g1~~TRINITY_DN32769_c0_g1_i1.p1  ORF type:complete len:459 (-),score=56.08 TRINITY_DN32769_c0_g1_i1:216-1592(-)
MSAHSEREKRLLLQKIAGEADLRLVEVLIDIAGACSIGSEFVPSANVEEKEVLSQSDSNSAVDVRFGLARAFAQQLAASLCDFDSIARSAAAPEKRDLSIMTMLDCKTSILECETREHNPMAVSATLSEDVFRYAANIAADTAAMAVSLYRYGKHTEYTKLNEMREELHQYASDAFKENDRKHALGAQTDECMKTDGKLVCVRIQHAVTGAFVAELDTRIGASGLNLRRQLSEHLQDSQLLQAQFLYDSNVLALGAPLWMGLPDEIPDVLDFQMTIRTGNSFEKVSSQEYSAMLKLMLVGNAEVGKTSLMHRFVDDTFATAYISTIGVDFKIDTRKSSDGRVIKVQVWDIAGDDRFRTITSSYYGGCNGFLLVFDITARDTFTSLDGWYEEVSRATDPSSVRILLVGTKADLENERQVSKEEAQAWARSHGLHYFETSSKEGSSVSFAFDELLNRCLQ